MAHKCRQEGRPNPSLEPVKGGGGDVGLCHAARAPLRRIIGQVLFTSTCSQNIGIVRKPGPSTARVVCADPCPAES
jgi:hypothetical protein